MRKPTITNHLPAVCFAPPLTDELLEKYRLLIVAQHGDPAKAELKDALEACFACVLRWWNLPASKERPTTWQTRRPDGSPSHFDETPLSAELIQQLDATTPWLSECKLYQQLFGELPLSTPAEKELRDAAFHLLWHAIEITHDREPLTSDVVK
jgi:hypothetical protein